MTTAPEDAPRTDQPTDPTIEPAPPRESLRQSDETVAESPQPTGSTQLADPDEFGTESTQRSEKSQEVDYAGSASADQKPEEQLQSLIEALKSAQLTRASEEQALRLLRLTIQGGPKTLPATLDALLALPWSISVKGVADAWPETKPAGRARLLNGLAKIDTEVSRRVRLSLARGLHSQDPGARSSCFSAYARRWVVPRAVPRQRTGRPSRASCSARRGPGS